MRWLQRGLAAHLRWLSLSQAVSWRGAVRVRTLIATPTPIDIRLGRGHSASSLAYDVPTVEKKRTSTPGSLLEQRKPEQHTAPAVPEAPPQASTRRHSKPVHPPIPAVTAPRRMPTNPPLAPSGAEPGPCLRQPDSAAQKTPEQEPADRPRGGRWPSVDAPSDDEDSEKHPPPPPTMPKAAGAGP